MKSGGGRRDRTDDLMLAKQLLSQLSYAPEFLMGSTNERAKEEVALAVRRRTADAPARNGCAVARSANREAIGCGGPGKT